MTRIPSVITVALFSSFGISTGPARAGELGQEKITPGEEVLLDDGDRQMITMEILKTHPQLSGSPGIKYAEAWRDVMLINAAQSSLDSAFVVFYPHTESRGIKSAYQAHCERHVPSSAWSCGSVEIRRYVKLDSQDFEVRVKGNLDLEGILAVIEATREPARTSLKGRPETPSTAIIVFPSDKGYVVSWASEEGVATTSVIARLRRGGNPSHPNDWEALVMFPAPGT